MLESLPFLLAQLNLDIWGKDDKPSDEEDGNEDLFVATCVYLAYDSIR